MAKKKQMHLPPGVSLLDIDLAGRELYRAFAPAFEQVTGQPLTLFWDHRYGFNLDDFADYMERHLRKGESLNNATQRLWGDAAVLLITRIMCTKPKQRAVARAGKPN